MDSTLKKRLAQLQDLSDEQLLEEFVHREDFNPLSLLISRYQALVFGYCLKHLRERETARDIAMIILERILQNAPKAQIRYFKSWLMTVIRHEVRDAQKRLRRELDIFRDYDEARSMVAEPAQAYEAMPPQAIEQREEILRQAIAGLREEQRLCLELFYFEEKSYKEIAELTGLPLSEIKSCLQNGKRNLLKKLESDPHFKDGL